ncbi:MAG TPA: multicopper oxidase domain-containing protein [Acidimicrobiales bacterium]|nr:multicopper oxidase domain-containing protein [Acidimicrobiales bacterium]
MTTVRTIEDRTTRWYFLALIALFASISLPMAAMGAVAVWNDDRGPATVRTSNVDVELSEFKISGNMIAAPGEVTLTVTNKGSIAHNLIMTNGPRTAMIQPGETATLELGKLAAGSYELFCDVPGHTESGMRTTLSVNSTAVANSHSEHMTGEIDYAKLDKAMADSIAKFPTKTEGIGATLLAPKVLSDGTKEFDLTAKIGKWEVEPGRIVDAWTYNGVVPGPTIKVDVGDKVRLVVHNELPMGTDVHVHGIEVPNNMDGVSPITQPVIEPGTTFVYEFTTNKPAVAMYHAHHHGQMQVPNGLFAPFFVGQVPLPTGRTISGLAVPTDLTITREIPMVLNDAGVIGLTLNGKSFPATEPYAFKTGEWFIVHYFNEGLQSHPMHLHQFPQIVIALDGLPLDSPYAADTISVAPGERVTALVKADKLGTWVWHCHILNHVERDEGMFGMVTAVIVS